MRKWAAVLGVLAVLALAAPASAEVTFNEKEELNLVVWVQCANDGAGENVGLSGYLHRLFTLTEDGKGGAHVKYHFQPQHLTGYGQTTGLKYNGTGVTQENSYVSAFSYPYTRTYINNFRIIGQGPGNNYLVHETWHITVNANGEVTAQVDNYKIDCK